MDIIPTNTFVVLDSCENDELEDIARNCGIDLGGAYCTGKFGFY
jgi:hypothetical protein